MLKKRFLSLIGMAIVLAGLSSFWFYLQAQAQIDSFTFFIPFKTDSLAVLFDAGADDPRLTSQDDITTTISIAIQIDNTQIIYDHWEDQLEADLIKPTQASTQLWGDGNLANGVAPTVRNQAGGDSLVAGDVIVLQNLVVVPLDPSVLHYDGGDALTSIGGAVAVTLAAWPKYDPDPTQIGPRYAAAWELYPTNRWGTTYQSPVGPDLAGMRPGFTVVGINAQAVLDGTEVRIEFGPFCAPETAILSKGESFMIIASAVAPCGGLPVISAINGRPIQAHFFATDPSQVFEGRGYTLLPRNDWSHDLLAPRSSDGDFWLYNPHNQDLPLMVQSFTGTTVITIPALNTVKYPQTGLSAATGLRFTALDPAQEFYGMGALDQADVRDWGYSLLAIERLTAQTLIGWAPGNANTPPGPLPCPPPSSNCTGNESPVYVTAVTTTTVTVDYDNNRSTPNDTLTILPLQEVAITDPNDFDMTGAFLFTDLGGSFLAVWGQAQTAPPQLPSIDVGTNIVPLPSFGIRKVAGPISEDVDCNGAISVGDTFRYTVTYHNQGNQAVTRVAIEDFLPAEVEYIPNSTEIISGPGLGPVPDDTGLGRTPFPLDEGGYDVGDLPFLASGSLIFEVKIVGDIPTIINTATVKSLDIALDTVKAVTYTPQDRNIDPLYRIEKTLVAPTDGIVSAGDLITYTVTITNSSPLSVSNTITNFTLQDSYEANYLTFRQAIPTPSLTSTGIITWSDLTTIFGDLQPGATAQLTVSFEMALTPTSPLTITNLVSGIDPTRRDGTRLPTCRAQESLRFAPPASASLSLNKTFRPLTNLICSRSVNPGDRVEFRIDYDNQSSSAVTNVNLEDNLLPGLSYIPNSTRLNGLPLADGGGSTPFPLDEGGYNLGNVSAQQSGFLTFAAQVNAVATELRNQVQASSADLPAGSNRLGADEVIVFNPATANTEPALQLSLDVLAPADGVAAAGEVARFALNLTNLSRETLTKLGLDYTFAEPHLIFRNASAPPSRSEAGTITWDDLTGNLGDLAPGQTFSLIIDFVVGSIPEGVSTTTTTITVREAVLSDGTTVQACQARANLGFNPPPPRRETPTPPPPPPPPPPGPPVSTATPPASRPTATVFPVSLLPETGFNPAPVKGWSLIVLSILGLGLIWWLRRRRDIS